MTGVKETVQLNGGDLLNLEMFRMALSEPNHESRMRAITALRHDRTNTQLETLFSSEFYLDSVGPEDWGFLRWAAESAATRHEAMVDIMEVGRRYEDLNERRLNVAEEIGFKVIGTILDGAFGACMWPGVSLSK